MSRTSTVFSWSYKLLRPDNPYWSIWKNSSLCLSGTSICMLLGGLGLSLFGLPVRREHSEGFCSGNSSTFCVCDCARAVCLASTKRLPASCCNVSFVLGDNAASTSSPLSTWTRKVSFGWHAVSSPTSDYSRSRCAGFGGTNLGQM